MAAILLPSGFAEWGGMLQEKDSWFKPRGYLHFDMPINYKQACQIVKAPEKVSQHAFYPFLSYSILSRKISKKQNTGQLVSSEKRRLIAYASHVDSHIYSYYASLLNEKYEELLTAEGIDSCVIAFRKLGRSNIDFANQAFDEIIARRRCTAIALDVESFFDNLDHQILKRNWALLVGGNILPNDHYNIFKSLTRYASVDKNAVYRLFNISKRNPKRCRKRICEPSGFRNFVRKNGLITQNALGKGIPQGSPISALLSNIYMIDFDRAVSAAMNIVGGCYLRYCDDILCIVPHVEKDDTEDFVMEEIQKIKLSIQPKKTVTSTFNIVHGLLTCDKSLQYLGFNFDGQRKLIRSAAFARFSERMKSGVRLAKKTQEKANKARKEKGLHEETLYRKKLYERYSHLGKQNFIRYGFISAKKMESRAIKKQLKPLWKRLNVEIEKEKM